ncbi:ATP-binding protein [Thiohalorhabdus sp. Cl-TMA]|uniref:histidine kinase n=1 Tax=Thiohalorhabdus methylotrophus TaxID=3242694 RepID=A0ABV4TRL6_9GAMM
MKNSPPSLRRRLFWVIAGTLAVVWTAAAGWIFVALRAEVNGVLDAKLVESANLVQNLWHGATAPDPGRQNPMQGAGGTTLTEGLACQVWSLNGQLLSRSDGAPQNPLSQTPSGFSEATARNERWRVYAAPANGEAPRVVVGERLAIRDGLANRIAAGLTLPFLLGLPALALAISFAVRRGLKPLQAAARRVENLTPDAVEPLGGSDKSPGEVAPLLAAIDRLLGRLRETLARERRFLGDAAHQLRTPLAALKTQAQVALDSPQPEQREHALHQLVAGADRTDRLVYQLLTLARLDESGQFPKEPVDLRGVITRAREVLAGQAKEARIRLETSLPEDPVIVQGSSEALESLLTNLIHNAIRYGRRDGRVRMRLNSNPPSLEVEDNGPGLAPEERERALARFYRGNQSTGQGSGLGLPIAARVAELHDGFLEMGEGAEGTGLRVTVWFPNV